MDTVTTECKCRACGAVEQFAFPKEQFERLARGKTHEEAFPGIEPWQIRVFREHLCRECQSVPPLQ